MISEKIRMLREQAGYSQAQLAKILDVTRSSVNAWEMGLSTPTTQYIVMLARLFHVSADYILGIEGERSISLRNCTEEEITLLLNLLRYFEEHRGQGGRDDEK